ncbi:MAG: sulfotransferase [Fidelibacterota bacterium]
MDILKENRQRRKKKYVISQHQLYIVRPDVWRKLKRANRIDKEYRYVARRISLYSYLFRPLQILQNNINRKKIRQIDFYRKAPVFVIGHWRSGTTFLHYILSKDERFGYLCNYQALIFNIALLSKKMMRALSRPFFPKERPQDSIKMSPYYPAEEEQPFTTISTRSGMHTFFFPHNRSYFDKYNLFKGITPKEKKHWKKDYLYLLKNISLYNDNKPLLLKNPHNTGRVKELLELFPDAKFIFLHRDPYTTYMSMMHLFDTVVRTQFFQRISDAEIHELVIYMFRETLKKYMHDRSQVPEGNLAEVSYAELTGDPLGAVKNIYTKLGLPGYNEAEPNMRRYLQKVGDYKKNIFKEMPHEVKEELGKELEFYFDVFGYEK